MRIDARQLRTPDRLRSGFTLLELVVVMLLIALMLALAVPQMRGFLAGSRSRDTATQLVALTGYARARSAAEAKVYRLNFEGDSFFLTVEDGPAFAPIRTDFGRPVTIPKELRVELIPLMSQRMGTAQQPPDPAANPDDGRGISFYPDGRPASSLLRVTDDQGRVTLIASPSPAESFRVVTEEEAKNL